MEEPQIGGARSLEDHEKIGVGAAPDEEEQGAAEEVVEEVHDPKGTLLRRRCVGEALIENIFADGKGGEKSTYKPMAIECSGELTRDSLRGAIDFYGNLLSRTNMLSKVEAAEIAAFLQNYRFLVGASPAVVEQDDGYYYLSLTGLRKLTLWETIKWHMFGAVPRAIDNNANLLQFYSELGVNLEREYKK